MGGLAFTKKEKLYNIFIFTIKIRMKTELLYLNDSYLKEFEATVLAANDKYIILDRTAFYYTGGGQPHDTGVLITEDGTKYNVVYVGKFSGDISHEVDASGLKAGDKVKGIINWQRRYALMRAHTAAHVLSGVIHKETGAMITGNQLGTEKTRIDFSLENFDKAQMNKFIEMANEIIDRDLRVKSYILPREEAYKIDKISKLAKGLPPDIDQIRIVEIEGFDMQPDGGTHVEHLKEVGHLKLLKCENKGANNRRVYFTLE